MSSTWIGKWIERSLEWNYNESLAVRLLGISCSSHSSWVLQILLIFEHLWWKFFGALELESNETSMDQSLWSFWRLQSLIPVEFWDLERIIWMNVLRLRRFVVKVLWALEAWIHRASLVCSFLVFMEVFELDSNEFWDLEGWLECFCFTNL